jgi:predicted SprT family Zn-dependent metalloprotease
MPHSQSQLSAYCGHLLDLFIDINIAHFDGFLEPPHLCWNYRLRTSAGRFFPGSRKYSELYPPRIEIASYLRQEKEADKLIADTLAHEMIHYWLWIRHRPYGHTPEFLAKMKEMGVNRYNPVPKLRPVKHIYQCMGCQKEFRARKKLGNLACAECCKNHAGGKYDLRFKLVYLRRAQIEEAVDKVSCTS